MSIEKDMEKKFSPTGSKMAEITRDIEKSIEEAIGDADAETSVVEVAAAGIGAMMSTLVSSAARETLPGGTMYEAARGLSPIVSFQIRESAESHVREAFENSPAPAKRVFSRLGDSVVQDTFATTSILSTPEGEFLVMVEKSDAAGRFESAILDEIRHTSEILKGPMAELSAQADSMFSPIAASVRDDFNLDDNGMAAVRERVRLSFVRSIISPIIEAESFASIVTRDALEKSIKMRAVEDGSAWKPGTEVLVDGEPVDTPAEFRAKVLDLAFGAPSPEVTADSVIEAIRMRKRGM